MGVDNITGGSTPRNPPPGQFSPCMNSVLDKYRLEKQGEQCIAFAAPWTRRRNKAWKENGSFLVQILIQEHY